jgi:hypothetical protein
MRHLTDDELLTALNVGMAALAALTVTCLSVMSRLSW